MRRVTGWGDPAELRAGVSGTRATGSTRSTTRTANDPEFEIHCAEDWGTCEVEGMRVRIPDAAKRGRRLRRRI